MTVWEGSPEALLRYFWDRTLAEEEHRSAGGFGESLEGHRQAGPNRHLGCAESRRVVMESGRSGETKVQFRDAGWGSAAKPKD